jgi:hypothetical protein
MQCKTLVVLSAVAVLGVGSTAMAKGGMGMGMGMHGHGHFVRHFDHRFRVFNRFNGNPFLFGGGWDWGLGSYGEGNGNNTTVVVSQPPVSRFPVAGVTGSTGGGPCHWNTDTFTVPSSSGGGNRPVEVVSCR